MKWISIQDKLPEEEREVLLYIEHYSVCGVKCNEIKTGYYENEDWYWNRDVFPYEYEVTHWMPLPPEPEIDNGEHQ